MPVAQDSVSTTSGLTVTFASTGLSAVLAPAYFPDFQQRVMMAGIACAIAVKSEGSGVANHANRAAFAEKYLADPASYSFGLALAVANDGTGVSASDDDIVTRAADLWDTYSAE